MGSVVTHDSFFTVEESSFAVDNSRTLVRYVTIGIQLEITHYIVTYIKRQKSEGRNFKPYFCTNAKVTSSRNIGINVREDSISILDGGCLKRF